MKLTDYLEKMLGPLPKTLFFEYPTLEAVSTFIASAFDRQLKALFELSPATAGEGAHTGVAVVLERPAVDEPDTNTGRAMTVETEPPVDAHEIAVIGAAGRFPLA